MRRRMKSGASSSPPPNNLVSEGHPSPGNPTLSEPASILGAYWFHLVQEAIVTVIEEASLTPDDSPTQFREAIKALIAASGTLTWATNAQALAGSSTSLAINPANLKHVINALIDSAPGALDTLNELAAAINDDANFATTITNALALKAPLASPALTGTPTAPTPPEGDSSKKIATTKFVTDIGGSPSGQIGLFAMATPPTGWLKCKGQAVSRATYAALFTAIGTTYGAGDNSSTFNLPDLRGQFVRGYNEDSADGDDDGRVLGSSQAGQNLSHSHGDGTLSATSNGNHTHQYEDRQLSWSGIYYSWFKRGTVNGGDSGATKQLFRQSGQAGSHSHTVSGTTSASGGTENRPKNIALAYFIKT